MEHPNRAGVEMTCYTMTMGGCYGPHFYGDTPEDCAAAAEAAGFEVLDIVDHGGPRDTEWVLVVADC